MSTSPSRLTAREQPSLTTPSTAVSGLYSTEQSPREHTVSIAQSFTELIDRGALWDAAARCQQLASCKDAEDVLLSECDLLCQMMWRSLGHKVHPRALLGPFLLHACGSAIVERCCRTRLPALVNFVCAALDSLAATGESPKLHGSLLHVAMELLSPGDGVDAKEAGWLAAQVRKLPPAQLSLLSSHLCGEPISDWDLSSVIRWISRLLGHRYQHFIERHRDTMREQRELNWRLGPMAGSGGDDEDGEFDGLWDRSVVGLQAGDWLNFAQQEALLLPPTPPSSTAPLPSASRTSSSANGKRQRPTPVLLVDFALFDVGALFASKRDAQVVQETMAKISLRLAKDDDILRLYDEHKLLAKVSRESVATVDKCLRACAPLYRLRKALERRVSEHYDVVVIAADLLEALSQATVLGLDQAVLPSHRHFFGSAVADDDMYARIAAAVYRYRRRPLFWFAPADFASRLVSLPPCILRHVRPLD